MKAFEELLKEAVAIKSISTDPLYSPEIQRMVKWLQVLLQENRFTVDVVEGYGNPVIVASFADDPEKQTCLIYGHYDVQPAEKKDGWKTEPFLLSKEGGKYVGRGVVDNKGQFLIHLWTILFQLEQEKLKYNIKLIIEGDEETGGRGLGQLLSKRKDLFASDVVLISDGEMPYSPVLTASFRGTFNTTVRYSTANNNMHSGLYGGAVPNAAEELAKFVAGLHDQDGNVAIEGFYDDDAPVSVEDVNNCLEMDKSRKEMLGKTGCKKYFTYDEGGFSKQVGFRSMLSVSGIQSGYTGVGYSNIVPCSAEAKINFRLAADQDPKNVFSMFKSYVEEHTPEYVTSEVVSAESMSNPVRVNLSSPVQVKVRELLKEVYGADVLVDYCGASIPIVAEFQKVLGIDPLLVSLANDDCNMHGVDENFDMGLVEKGLEFSRKFFGI
jgi:acetylornithine deacetylase/succinyl-diaminopimelate desuccinylase-like protein